MIVRREGVRKEGRERGGCSEGRKRKGRMEGLEEGKGGSVGRVGGEKEDLA